MVGKCRGTGTGSLDTIRKVLRQGTIWHSTVYTVPLHVVPSNMATQRTYLQDTNGIQAITTTKGLGSHHTITGMFTTIHISTSFSQPVQHALQMDGIKLRYFYDMFSNVPELCMYKNFFMKLTPLHHSSVAYKSMPSATSFHNCLMHNMITTWFHIGKEKKIMSHSRCFPLSQHIHTFTPMLQNKQLYNFQCNLFQERKYNSCTAAQCVHVLGHMQVNSLVIQHLLMTVTSGQGLHIPRTQAFHRSVAMNQLIQWVPAEFFTSKQETVLIASIL